MGLRFPLQERIHALTGLLGINDFILMGGLKKTELLARCNSRGMLLTNASRSPRVCIFVTQKLDLTQLLKATMTAVPRVRIRGQRGRLEEAALAAVEKLQFQYCGTEYCRDESRLDKGEKNQTNFPVHPLGLLAITELRRLPRRFQQDGVARNVHG
ncbi:uncharacterized protein BDR25DRAFT_310099 [Lindgomyces ingoldianus]|uniref:Uncharacterized protein n=1 Tax=Lindgomyces ingoldianus TaxID=673940 RepID=A0ACB6REM0_9PLEO|nr:uncharacterized protein BDR25DRAFT_310099 [Lindgomyces ingoldianus]KAF2476765.1 hypothetical protein BDR25DRAFT_310099 [Lindgomyces ingoldianus]